MEIAERRAVCGRTLAVVVAAGPSALGEVEAAVDAVCWAQTAFVFVVAAPAVSEKVGQRVHLMKHGKNAPVVQVVECDDEAIRQAVGGDGREIVDALVGATPVECDRVLVVEATEPVMTGEQVVAFVRDNVSDREGSAPSIVKA